MKVLVIDNYDSFTYNLVDYLYRLGASCRVYKNDDEALDKLVIEEFDAMVLSPGPQRPKDAGKLFLMLERFHKVIPILGVCLGHQAIGEFFGARLVHAPLPVHGKVAHLQEMKGELFEGIEQPMQIMRYHSLILEDIPKKLQITAQTKDKLVMAVQHRAYPIYGVQFHPESILTTEGLKLLANFLEMVKN